MKKLEINEQQAKGLYGDPKAFDKMLEMNFGKKFFVKSIRDLGTYEECCVITGETPMDEEKMLSLGFYPREIARRKLETIYAAANILNDNWEADFSDPNQPKHFNWAIWRSGAFRFDGTSSSYARTAVGSRLCCGVKEDEYYIGEQFESLFNEFLS